MEKQYAEYNDKGTMKRYYAFEKLTTNTDAYFIGYMACDGAFIFNKGKSSYMSVNSTEHQIIYGFRDEYVPDASVIEEGTKSSEKVKANNPVIAVRFTTKMNPVFNKYGVFSYKKERRLVGVPKKCLGAYIRGVIDADGFITVGHRKDCRTPRLRWFITHGSERYLIDLQRAIYDTWMLPTTIRQHGDNVWRLCAQNTELNKVFLKQIFSIHLPFYNLQKARIVDDYLYQYFVPQKSGELLENP